MKTRWWTVLAVLIAASPSAASGQAAKSVSKEQGLAAFETVKAVFQHPRCQNCHIPGDAPLFDVDHPHAMNVRRGPDGNGAPGQTCATCHGADAKGHGPVAAALITPPPDLTRLARRNGGSFPRVRVGQFIAGGGTTLRGAHGSTEMPVWGPVFRALDPSDERRVLIRIENVVQYLESIQGK